MGTEEEQESREGGEKSLEGDLNGADANGFVVKTTLESTQSGERGAIQGLIYYMTLFDFI